MGTHAQGSKLWLSQDDGTTYDQIIGVTTLSTPASNSDDIEVTHLSSTAKEYIQGLSDGGELDYPILFDATDAQHQALMALKASKANAKFKLEIPEKGVATVTSVIFTASVKDLVVTLNTNDKQDASLKLRVTGDETIAFGATAQA